MEKVAFQVRHSAPESEREEKVHQAEETACTKDLRWEENKPSKKQKNNVTGVLDSKEGGWLKMTDGDQITKDITP